MLLAATMTLNLVAGPALGAEAPKEAAPAELRHPDLEIFMDLAASDGEIANVRAEILASGKKVKRFAFVSQEEAVREYDHLFKDRPGLEGRAQVGDLPVSFRLKLRGDRSKHSLDIRFGAIPGVDTVAGAPDRRTAEERLRQCRDLSNRLEESPDTTEVFMDLSATTEQIDGVQMLMVSRSEIMSWKFLDHEDAYAVFKRLFKDEPGLVKSIRPQDLPVSFRIELVKGTDEQLLADKLTTLPGVDGVTTPTNVLQNFARDCLLSAD